METGGILLKIALCFRFLLFLRMQETGECFRFNCQELPDFTFKNRLAQVQRGREKRERETLRGRLTQLLS